MLLAFQFKLSYPVHAAAGSVEPPNEEVKSMTKWVQLITKKT